MAKGKKGVDWRLIFHVLAGAAGAFYAKQKGYIPGTPEWDARTKKK